MEIIKIKDYVSNDDYANKIITNFDNNKLIIKGDTGVGGTSAVLNITDQNIIIVSPLSGMIAGKEIVRKPHQMFIYQGSKDRWQHYEHELKVGSFVILNTTPEQIIELKKNNEYLYKKVLDIPFFVDESQVYSESDYRASMPIFYNILFDEHRGNFTLSTATPTHNNLDIPKHILDKMQIIKIELEVKRQKNITVSPINNYWNFIKSNCERGVKVVLFTNDLKKIKNIKNNDTLAYKTQLLVGDTLAVKSSAVKSKTFNEYDYLVKSKIDYSADVYVLSTKYLIGYDLPFDAAVGIIMDENSIVDKFNVNQVVQAYGRVRNNVVEAEIFYSSRKPNIIDVNKLETAIQKIEYNKNYLQGIQPIIKEINHSLSYPKSNLINSLHDYGFTITEDDNVETVTNVSSSFPIKYRNLINQEDQDPYILHKELIKVYNKIKGDDPYFNGYSMKDLLLWATAYIAVETNSGFLLNADAQRYERLLKTAKTFIDVNDLAYPEKMNDLDKITKFRMPKNIMDIAINAGAVCKANDNGETTYGFDTNMCTDNAFSKAKQIINSLYVIYLVENGEYSEETNRIIFGFSVVSKCILEDYVNALSTVSNLNVSALLEADDKVALDSLSKKYGKELKGNKIFNNTTRKISAHLKKLDGYNDYSQKEINQIMDKATAIKQSLLLSKHGIRNTIKMNTYSIEAQIERHKNYILSLLSLSCAGHMFGFKTTNIDNRVFNTATKTTRQLRPYTPYEMIQSDIRSAFASFLDTIVGSDISQEVYNNLKAKYNMERDNAKTIYNMMLNDNTRNVLEAKKFFTDCGYTKEQVSTIIKLTLNEKGSFYRTMTKMEDELIRNFKYINRLDHTAVRLHDAVIMFNTPNNQNLTNEIGNFKFEIKKI